MADIHHPCFPSKDLVVEYEDRDFIQPTDTLTLELSRGCKFACKFCSYNAIGMKGDLTRDMDTLYDEVNTEVLDEYPSDKISKDYWSSPKLWVMKHQEEPFLMLDTDLVLHNITPDVLERAQVSFLHTESPTTYAFPSVLNKPKAFKWSDWDVMAFINTMPANCAAICFTDMEFLKRY